MTKIVFQKKLVDTIRIPFGKIEMYWYRRIFKAVFPGRSQSDIDKPEFWIPEKAIEAFNLNGFEYGNWLNQEDRYQYLVATNVALADLAKITGLSRPMIGMGGLLAFAFGARGRGRALAHFEPNRWVINLTRFRRGSEHSRIRYISGGGSGAVAHEWAHALDRYLQVYYAKPNKADAYLTQLTNQWFRQKRDPSGFWYRELHPPTTRLEKLVYEIMKSIIVKWDQQLGLWVESEHMKRTREFAARHKTASWDYLGNPVELWARSYEVFIAFESKRKSQENVYLVDGSSLNPVIYQNTKEMATSAPKWRALMKYCRSVLVEDDSKAREYQRDYARW